VVILPFGFSFAFFLLASSVLSQAFFSAFFLLFGLFIDLEWVDY
jgi:hypothetical protein